MHHFRTNPPSRQIPPTPALLPSTPRPDPLRARVEDYLALTETTAGTFGRAAAGDFGLVRKLRAGERVDPSTAARVERYIAAALAAEGMDDA